MKKFLLFSFVFVLVLGVAGCSKDDHSSAVTITIMQPDDGDKDFGSAMHMHVNFQVENDETLHNIAVKIIRDSDGVEVFSGPDNGHIHEESGYHEFHGDFDLNSDNNVLPEQNYTLEASAWGHDDDAQVFAKSVTFYVIGS